MCGRSSVDARHRNRSNEHTVDWIGCAYNTRSSSSIGKANLRKIWAYIRLYARDCTSVFNSMLWKCMFDKKTLLEVVKQYSIDSGPVTSKHQYLLIPRAALFTSANKVATILIHVRSFNVQYYTGQAESESTYLGLLVNITHMNTLRLTRSCPPFEYSVSLRVLSTVEQVSHGQPRR